MKCTKNKPHKILIIEDPAIYDGISYIYCYDCKKIYDRWTNADITEKYQNKVNNWLILTS